MARGDRAIVKGSESAARLSHRDVFGDRWLGYSLDERNKIVRVLLDTEDPDKVRRLAVSAWKLTQDKADALIRAPFPRGDANLSSKAIFRLLPNMERRRSYDEAAVAAVYPHHSDSHNSRSHKSLTYYGVVLKRHVVVGKPNAGRMWTGMDA